VQRCKNGILNLRTNEFDKLDYITFSLHYNYYEKKDEEKINEIKKIIHRICNDDDKDYEFACEWNGMDIV
jgi:phage/plasmid-associated DNA primase